MSFLGIERNTEGMYVRQSHQKLVGQGSHRHPSDVTSGIFEPSSHILLVGLEKQRWLSKQDTHVQKLSNIGARKPLQQMNFFNERHHVGVLGDFRSPAVLHTNLTEPQR